MTAALTDDLRVRIRDFVEEAKNRTGVATWGELARMAKINPSTISRIVGQNGPAHMPRHETIEAIASAARMTLPPELTELLAPRPVAVVTAPALTLSGDLVPVHALVGSRVPGWFFRNASPMEWLPRLPGLIRRQRVFALRMPDASMRPWRRENEPVFVDPTWAVAEGDHALVEVSDDVDQESDSLFAVRRYLGRLREGSWRFGSYGSDVVETIPANRLLQVRRTLEWTEVAHV